MRTIKSKHNEYSFSQAYRFLENAKQTIAQSSIEYGAYTDERYTREAAGIAYLSALKAIDTYLINKGVTQDDLPNSIEEYRKLIGKKIPLNGKLSAALRIVYDNLHLLAYYRGGTGVKMIKEGFENCKKIIDMMAVTK